MPLLWDVSTLTFGLQAFTRPGQIPTVLSWGDHHGHGRALAPLALPPAPKFHSGTHRGWGCLRDSLAKGGLLAGQSGGETGHTPSPLQGTPLCCLGLCPPQAASAATYGFWEPQGLGNSPQAEGGIALTQGIGDGEGALAELGPGVIQAASLVGTQLP